MVELAQQREVWQVGHATPNPPIQMVGLGEDRVGDSRGTGTAQRATLPPLGCSGEATLAALIDGVPVVIVDRVRYGKVASQVSRRTVETDQPTSLQVAHQCGGVTGLVDQGGQRCMEDRKERARFVTTARTARGPGPD